ncbi:hypothetical protein ANN_04643 [Periplaneta americana]|uniref:Uncharacterized protein n=1 Tax=Periplaneta americana TaxID=6978 RepID=A0ABQ8TBD9_PERAM|nr:hypothetical protein ANN_04643 [Periplaneta americana]
MLFIMGFQFAAGCDGSSVELMYPCAPCGRVKTAWRWSWSPMRRRRGYWRPRQGCPSSALVSTSPTQLGTRALSGHAGVTIQARYSVCAGPSSSSSRQHLSVTILELCSSPGGMDSDTEKLSTISAGGLEPPIVMTPGGASPERRESNNSTRSGAQAQHTRSSGSDVILADSNSDTFGPGDRESLVKLQKDY